jgi:hypothetical protein
MRCFWIVRQFFCSLENFELYFWIREDQAVLTVDTNTYKHMDMGTDMDTCIDINTGHGHGYGRGHGHGREYGHGHDCS